MKNSIVKTLRLYVGETGKSMKALELVVSRQGCC
jgi:hypothetical protein